MNKDRIGIENKPALQITRAELDCRAGIVPNPKPAQPKWIGPAPDIMLPEDLPAELADARTPTVTGSHTDKAWAYQLSTFPLSFGFGLSIALFAWQIYITELTDPLFYIILFAVFAVAQSGMYLWDKQNSPDGKWILSEKLRHKRIMRQLEIVENLHTKHLEQSDNE